MQVYFLDPTTSPSFQISTITPLPSANTLHHVAAVYQQTTSTNVQIQTYIDGTLKLTSTLNGKLGGTFDNSPITIGASNPTTEWFNGLIDEASIYNRALSATEIQAIYSANSQGKCPDFYNPWLVEWGGTPPPPPPGMGRSKVIDGGLNFNVALLNDGTVTAWGDNTYGQTTIPPLFTPVKSLSAAYYHAAAVQANGQVIAWGQTYGQIPLSLNNAVSVSVGWRHTIALRSDGTTSTWGDPSDCGSTNYPGLSGAAAIAAGWEHNVALLTNGTVVAWGADYDLLNRYVTTVPQGLSNVIAIAAGGYHTIALKSNGTVVAWGAGNGTDQLFSYGQSIVPTGLSNVVAIAAGGHSSMALRNDGSVVAWGQNGPAGGLNNVIAIGVSDNAGNLAERIGRQTPFAIIQPTNQCVLAGQPATFTALGMSTSGFTYQWQSNGVNIAGATSTTYTLTNAQTSNQVPYHVLLSNAAGSAVSQDATFNLLGQPVVAYQTPIAPVQVLYGATTNLTVIATNLGVCSFPMSYQWSLNNGNFFVPNGTNYMIGPAASTNSGLYQVTMANGGGYTNTSFSVAVAGEGQAVWWGNMSQPWNYIAGVTNVAGIAGGGNHALLVEDSGTVVAWGINTYGQTNVPSWLTNATAVAAGDAHSLALRTDGTVVGWGRDDLSLGQTNIPTGLTNVIAISAGGQQSLALSNNGSIVQWGQTFASQPPLSNAIAIASGTNFHLALLASGTVAAWGNNSSGQTNVPAWLSNVVAIAAGGTHALALRTNGTVVAWGSNTSGETNVPLTLTNVIAIAAGYGFSLALSNNGTLTAWGGTNYGQTTIPFATNSNIKLIAAGGYQGFASIFSPTVQYPINVSRDLLLVYNSNSMDSTNVLNYYLHNRPMVANALTLPINITNTPLYETVSPTDFTNQILNPVANWLALNPTKRPQYVILFPDVPSRVDLEATNTGNFPFYPNENQLSLTRPSVSYQVATAFQAWSPFITHINMGDSNTCIAYINKLANMGTNLLLSASVGNYGNTNYYFDDTRASNYGSEPSEVANAEYAVLSANPQASVTYTNVPNGSDSLSGHITRGTNVVGYMSWGYHGSNPQTNIDYPTNLTLVFTGNSGWYLIETIESQNGWRHLTNEGTFIKWFSLASHSVAKRA